MTGSGFFRLPGRLIWLWALLVAAPLAALAQEGPFAPGWVLKGENSTLSFQSVKNDTAVENSGFAVLDGKIDPDGRAELTVLLDSVDTKIDLRNVRMRFLFFETFTYPQARILARLDAVALADLPQQRRKVIRLPFTLDLHGVAKELEAQVAVVLITEELISVSSVAPVSVGVEAFGLLEGLRKLEEAAQVKILPSGSVTFDLLFARSGPAAQGSSPAPAAAAAAAGPAVPAAGAAPAALETKGDFSEAECLGRFEILSRSQSITFRTASARLSPESGDFLGALYDIVQRCPGMVIEVGGHTDSDGGEAANQQLSERRAEAVVADLRRRGIAGGRLVAKGYGEAQPIAGNETAEGKARNRRIVFTVLP